VHQPNGHNLIARVVVVERILQDLKRDFVTSTDTGVDAQVVTPTPDLLRGPLDGNAKGIPSHHG
jgi:hypothetical protein